VWAQNTDPFVFGGEFLYTGCQQHSHTGGPTQLARLRPGSVVLFGSGKNRRFVLDTVLVVGERWIDHSRQTLDRLDGQITDGYREVTIDRWYAGGVPDDRTHRLYFGATFDDPIEDMFSFFPCRPLADGDTRCPARPEIRLPGGITPTQTQKYKLTRLAARSQAADIWREVVRQVLAAGLRLGIAADLPSRVRACSPIEQTDPAGCAAA